MKTASLVPVGLYASTATPLARPSDVLVGAVRCAPLRAGLPRPGRRDRRDYHVQTTHRSARQPRRNTGGTPARTVLAVLALPLGTPPGALEQTPDQPGLPPSDGLRQGGGAGPLRCRHGGLRGAAAGAGSEPAGRRGPGAAWHGVRGARPGPLRGRGRHPGGPRHRNGPRLQVLRRIVPQRPGPPHHAARAAAARKAEDPATVRGRILRRQLCDAHGQPGGRGRRRQERQRILDKLYDALFGGQPSAPPGRWSRPQARA